MKTKTKSTLHKKYAHILAEGSPSTVTGVLPNTDVTANNISGAISAGANILGNSIQTATATKSIDNVKSAINEYANPELDVKSTEDLLKQWGNEQALKNFQSSDFTDQTAGSSASSILTSAGAGAAAGTLIAPGIGTAIGAGLGALASGLGVGLNWLSANKKANEANNLLSAAKNRRDASFANAARNVDARTDMNAAANYAALGGDLNSIDNFSNGVTEINNGGSHEENPYEGVPFGLAPDGKPNLVEEGEAIYKDFVFSNRIKVPKEVRNKYKLRGETFADSFKNIAKESEERPNDPISKAGLDDMATLLAIEQEKLKSKKDTGRKYPGGGYLDEYDNSQVEEPEVDAAVNEFWKNYGLEKFKEDTSTPNNKSANLSWLRYAEPLANLAAVGLDAIGVTNTPTTFDYIPDYSDISFKTLGDFLPYTPLDTRYEIAQKEAQANATRRAFMQSSSPSRSANILAADYNYLNSIGDTYRNAQLANIENRLKTAEFNRGTNQFNSQGLFQADSANAQNRLNYANADLSEARYNEDNSNNAWAARAANVGNLAESVANMGRESDAYNWRDMLLRAGVYGVLSEKPQNWTNDEWDAYRAGLKSMKAAKGGKLRKKKGLTY